MILASNEHTYTNKNNWSSKETYVGDDFVLCGVAISVSLAKVLVGTIFICFLLLHVN